MILAFLFGQPALAFPQAMPILLDGRYSDWAALEPIYQDSIGDNNGQPIDLGRIWAANDDRFLFLRFEAGAEINLQFDNFLTLYLDTDGSRDTGMRINGIGAELRWVFGQRTGTYFSQAGATPIPFAAIRLRTMPTVTSTEFEVAIGRDVVPDGYVPLFDGDTVRLVLRDEATGVGDQAPEAGQFVAFRFDTTAVPPPEAIPIEKDEAGALRVLTYNVLFGGPFDPDRRPRFDRILRAVRPDIICFQEMFNRSANEALDWLRVLLPLPAGEDWHAVKLDAGNITLSRYPFLGSWLILENSRMTATLIDLPGSWPADLLLVNAHLRCCEANVERQREADALAAFLRDAREPGGRLQIAEETPILIAGDLNLVGYRQQLETLLRGEIVDQARFGTGSPPDWDGTPLADLISRQTELRMAYTWRNDQSSFSPGRLDYMIYTDSVLEVVRHFLIYTPEMSPEHLNAADLRADDVNRASDHLPKVADFVFAKETRVGEWAPARPLDFVLYPSYPNPFNASTTVTFDMAEDGFVDLGIFNIRGERVATLVHAVRPAGRNRAVWRANNSVSGIYFCRLEVGDMVRVQKLAVVH